MAKRRALQLPKPAAAAPAADARAQAHTLLAEGARLLAARRPGEAIALLSQAWALDPHNAATAINLGGAYVLQGRQRQAIPILEAASRLEPDNPSVWTNLAAAYLGKLPFSNREQQDRAIAAFERALMLEPHAAHVAYNLGLIYLERDDLPRARACFFQALAADPDDRDAQRWLNRIHSGQTSARENQG
jgi:tetratricopeptide (TPR) repeat protein